ncbi:MAG: hypothetical protein EAZ53_15440 [Bacteroidetes bacterium]|nr:MAG: hypothetical protein EAZ53_15440 [Bacteroidota bacterium]
MLKTVHKTLFLTFSLIMLSFVVVQYNDPDPWLWMTIYGTVAIFLALGAFRIYFPVPMYIQMGLMAAGILYLFPSVIDWITLEKGENLMQQMNNSKLYIEETRECGGLIVALSFLILLWSNFRKNKI